jgi:hypothetical protein
VSDETTGQASGEQADPEAAQPDTVSGEQTEKDDAEATPEPSEDPQLKRWRTETRKWERRYRELKAEMDDRVPVSDLQRAQSEAATAQLEAIRYRVALEQGLPVEIAMRLQGDTLDDLTKDAATLKALLTPTNGTPAMKAGAAPDSAPTGTTAEDALRAALGLAPTSGR